MAALDELDGGAGGDTARNGLLLLSHEFYDCLPARTFEFRERQWQEKYVAFDEARGVFQFVLRPLDAHVRRYFLDKRLLVPANADASSLSPELLLAADALRARTERRGVARAARSGSRRPDRAPRRRPPRANRAASDSDESTEYEAVGEEGDYLEISFDAMATFEHSVKLLRKHGGAQLLIDYGNFTVDYPSLRFIKDHKLVRADEVDGQFLVDNVGKVDMSIDVHFAPLMAIAHKHGVKSYLSTQGAFLERNGGQVLALTRLANCADSAKAARLVADYERLTEPAEMGRCVALVCSTLALTALRHAGSTKCWKTSLTSAKKLENQGLCLINRYAERSESRFEESRADEPRLVKPDSTNTKHNDCAQKRICAAAVDADGAHAQRTRAPPRRAPRRPQARPARAALRFARQTSQ